MSGDQPTPDVETVLAEHQPTWTDVGFVCHACGHVFVHGNLGAYLGFRDPDEIKTLIRAHVAAVLEPLIREREAKAWDEGFAHQYQYTSASQENPHRGAALSDREGQR